MSLGIAWKMSLQANAKKTAQELTLYELQQQKADADRIIAKLPDLLAQAKEQGKTSVLIFQRLNESDVSGSRDECLDRLFNRRANEMPLTDFDLAGRSKIVFAWCKEQDLICFLKPHKTHFGNVYYNLMARPR